MHVQYDPWPLRSITDSKVAEPEVELVPLRAAAGQVDSGREYQEPVAVGRGILPVPPLTWHAPLPRTLGTFTD